MLYIVVSSNEKTGPIPVSTSPKQTCPDYCDLKELGCYARYSFLGKLWTNLSASEGKAFKNGKSTLTPISWDSFVSYIALLQEGTIWRHNQAGDLPGDSKLIDVPTLESLVRANAAAKALGFTYTHYNPHLPHNAAAIKGANDNGFTINLSANNPAQADEYLALGIAPVVVLLPSDVDGKITPQLTTPAGNSIKVCPATYLDTNCGNCGLCARRNRKGIVGFPAHGSAKKRVTFLANGKPIN